MNVGSVVIKLGDYDDFKTDLLRSVDEGPRGYNVLYLTPKQVPSMFTEQRLRLLKAIHEHPEMGVTKLAGLLGRKQEAVSRDVGLFKSLGLLKEEGKDAVPEKKTKRALLPFTLNLVL